MTVAIVALVVGLFLATQGARVAGHIITAAIVLLLVGPARGHDHDHPELDGWYKSLMQPDHPDISCCGEADAYWCDVIHVKAGKTFCTITDDRDNAPLKRPPVPLGTEVEIPDHKLKWDRGNPTGHAIVFMRQDGFVYCFVQGSGI